jgi:hypothetical protein
MKIYPIVEGYGEVQAVPVLIRRLLSEASCYQVAVGRPIRQTQSQLRGKETVQKAVKLACLQPDCAAVVILFDGEDSCPKELAQDIRIWAQTAAGKIPCEVVVAYREYETWFLSAIESLRGKYGISEKAVSPDDPESKRDAKGALEEFMPSTRSYSPTIDQPSMSQLFDMSLTYQRNRSFRKFVKTIGDLLVSIHHIPATWPPVEWTEE